MPHFILDDGCTKSVFNDLKFFTDFTERKSLVGTLNKKKRTELEAKGSGTVFIADKNDNVFHIPNAIYCPGAFCNIIAELDILEDVADPTKPNKATVTTTTKQIWNHDKTELITDMPRIGRLWRPQFKYWYPQMANTTVLLSKQKSETKEFETLPCQTQIHTCNLLSPTDDEDHWPIMHYRLGHILKSKFDKLKSKGGTLDMDEYVEVDAYDINCECCMSGKFKTAAFGKKVVFIPITATTIGEYLHYDCSGKISPPYRYKGKTYNYFMVVVDDKSRKCFVKLLETKDQVPANFIEILTQIERQTGAVCTKVRADNGELSTTELDIFFKTRGIDFQTSVANLPQQNGVAESAIKAIKNIARPIFHNSALPSRGWGPAILHGGDLYNLWPHTHNSGECPDAVYYGHPPRVMHHRVFGCKVNVPIYKRVRRGALTTLMKSRIYIGSHSRSIVKAIDPVTGNIGFHRFDDAQFFEDQFPELGSLKHESYEEDAADSAPINAERLQRLTQESIARYNSANGPGEVYRAIASQPHKATEVPKSPTQTVCV